MLQAIRLIDRLKSSNPYYYSNSASLIHLCVRAKKAVGTATAKGCSKCFFYDYVESIEFADINGFAIVISDCFIPEYYFSPHATSFGNISGKLNLKMSPQKSISIANDFDQ